MNAVEALRSVIDASGTSQYAMAKRLGISTASMSQTWGRRTIGSDKLVRLLGLVGWEVALVPKGSKLPKGAIVLEESE